MAITLTIDRAREVLGDVDNSPGDYFPEAFAAAVEAVRRYCPVAPDAIHNQAVLMTVGYWVSMPHDNPATMRELDGDRDIWSDTKRTANALRWSGAMALLSPHKRRRAL